MLPKTSILWVNYNSKPITDIALSSLSAINDLDYPNSELIIVDNGSTDGSFDVIKKSAERMKVKVKIYRSIRNLGFAGGNNIAYKLADKDSEFIVLLNNDTIPYSESLREIVVLNINGSGVDTAGDFLDEFLWTTLLPKAPKRVVPISYPDGSYTVIKRSALKSVGLIDRIFIDEAFAYFDDTYLGMKLWNHGYKVVALPVKAARHYRSASFKRYSKLQLYMGLRAWVTMINVTNTRLKPLTRIYYLRLLMRLVKREGNEGVILLNAIRDGHRLARKINEHFDIYKMPIVKLSMKEILKILATRGRKERERLKLKKVLQLIGEENECPDYWGKWAAGL